MGYLFPTRSMSVHECQTPGCSEVGDILTGPFAKPLQFPGSSVGPRLKLALKKLIIIHCKGYIECVKMSFIRSSRVSMTFLEVYVMYSAMS